MLVFAGIEYEVSFKRYLLENYDTNHFNSKSQFIILLLILAWNWIWSFIQTRPLWEIWHITLQFQIKFSQFCAYFWLKLVWNFIQKIPPWEIWQITLQFLIKILQSMLIASKNCIWILSQKIPPWVILHIPPHSKIRISRFCVYCELKLCMNFHSKDTSLRNMTCNSSIPNQIFSILCLFLDEISMTFHSKSTSLRNMTHNTSIPNQNSTIFAYC